MIIDFEGIKLQSHIAEKIKDFLDKLRTDDAFLTGTGLEHA